MRKIMLSAPQNEVWKASKDGKMFIPLGATPAHLLTPSAEDRIHHRTAGTTKELWGTLGAWDTCAPQGWQGALLFSNHGSEYSVPSMSGGETISLIDSVTRTTAMAPDARVRERFIDLSQLTFSHADQSFLLSQQPALRLTLFVKPDEGALVFLQHGALGEDGTDFITPESTGQGHSCSRRDRLHYRIPVLLDGGVAAATPAGDDVDVQAKRAAGALAPKTTLKILTFQRQNSPSHEVVRRALSRLGRDKSKLWRWNLSQGRWELAGPEHVHREAKTLLFLHGTFSSTRGSFSSLSEGGTWSWLQNVSIARQRYQQVLAFDHDTVLEDLAANEAQLEQAIGCKLDKPLDVVTHSRGGLLAKHLATRGRWFEVERAAMTGCANGVGYMRTLGNVARFLSVMRRMFGFTGAGDLVVALAQHSVNFVHKLPGLAVMDPRGAALLEVMRTPIPAPRTQTQFMPIVGDYDRRLVNEERFFKRLAMNGLDLIIKAILGGQHDWVVGSAEQAIVAPGHMAPGSILTPVSTWHTGYYGLDGVRERVQAHLLGA